MTTNRDDPQPVQTDVPPVEPQGADSDDPQSASEPPPIRMVGPDRGRLTRAAVELMLRNVID